jgi:hypothetical protein
MVIEENDVARVVVAGFSSISCSEAVPPVVLDLRVKAAAQYREQSKAVVGIEMNRCEIWSSDDSIAGEDVSAPNLLSREQFFERAHKFPDFGERRMLGEVLMGCYRMLAVNVGGRP